MKSGCLTPPNPALVLPPADNSRRDGARLRVHFIAQLACLLAAAALWPQLAQPYPLLAWWLGTASIQLMLATQPLRRRIPRATADDTALHGYLASAGTLLAGAAWGALALLGPYESSPHAQLTLFLILGGVVVGGAGVLAGSRGTYAVFTCTTLLPLFIQTLASPPPALPLAGLWLGVLALLAVTINDLLNSRLRAAPLHGGAAWRQHQTMLEHASEAIVLSHGNRVLHSNQRFAELIHDGPGNIAGRRLAAWLADCSEWRRHARAAAGAFLRGQAYRESVRLRRGDGSVFWADIAAQAVNPGLAPLQVVWVVSDISERVGATARQQLASAQLHDLLGHSADWYWQTDAQHRLTRITRHGADDNHLADSIGRHWWHFHRADGVPAGQAATLRAFESRHGFRNLLLEVPDGERQPRWLNICGVPRVNEHGAFVGHHGVALDVTEQVRGNERVRHLAYHDALTGLPNRRLLTDRLHQAIARARRQQRQVGVILVDLNDFKGADEYDGHAAGDRQLLDTASRLRACVRACDTVARLDDNDFVILLTELERPADAEQVASKVLAALDRPFGDEAPYTLLGTHIGITIFPHDADGADGLLELADARALQARRQGGPRIAYG
ncbi:MAG: diguanylate cyclase [Proteobacteria bacterium]|nr:diguanylate cyclase [Pseudomonadota bacterium]